MHDKLHVYMHDNPHSHFHVWLLIQAPDFYDSLIMTSYKLTHILKGLSFEHSKAPIVFLLWVGYILFIRIRRPEVFDDWLEFTNSIFQTEEEIDLVKVRALRTDLINSW